MNTNIVICKNCMHLFWTGVKFKRTNIYLILNIFRKEKENRRKTDTSFNCRRYGLVHTFISLLCCCFGVEIPSSLQKPQYISLSIILSPLNQKAQVLLEYHRFLNLFSSWLITLYSYSGIVFVNLKTFKNYL